MVDCTVVVDDDEDEVDKELFDGDDVCLDVGNEDSKCDDVELLGGTDASWNRKPFDLYVNAWRQSPRGGKAVNLLSPRHRSLFKSPRIKERLTPRAENHILWCRNYTA
jgi:hypothetical protein